MIVNVQMEAKEFNFFFSFRNIVKEFLKNSDFTQRSD